MDWGNDFKSALIIAEGLQRCDGLRHLLPRRSRPHCTCVIVNNCFILFKPLWGFYAAWTVVFRDTFENHEWKAHCYWNLWENWSIRATFWLHVVLWIQVLFMIILYTLIWTHELCNACHKSESLALGMTFVCVRQGLWVRMNLCDDYTGVSPPAERS